MGVSEICGNDISERKLEAENLCEGFALSLKVAGFSFENDKFVPILL